MLILVITARISHRILSEFGQAQVLLGGNGEGGTPDPIPNSVVKPFIADGTAHKSVEE